MLSRSLILRDDSNGTFERTERKEVCDEKYRNYYLREINRHITQIEKQRRKENIYKLIGILPFQSLPLFLAV